MSKRISRTGFLLLLLAACGPARAGTISASGIFSQFNALIFNNFTSTAGVGGRTAIGGNLTGGTGFDLNPGSAAASSFASLSVYGNATSGGNLNIQNGSGVAIAGSNNVSFNVNSGGYAYVGGSNSGSLTVSNATGSVTVGGANSGSVSLNSGGTVYLGSNTATLSASGTASVSINGNNTGNINLNGSSTVLLNGSNTGTISLNGGSVSYTGSRGNMNLNGGATATQVGSLSLTQPASTLSSFATLFQAPLTALSAQLDAVAANSTATSGSGAITFNAAPNSSGTAVFDINSSFLAANATVTMNLNGATSVIINVNVDSCAGTTCAYSLPNNLNFNNPSGYAETVLWNFVNATGLTFNTQFGGSILAPLAMVTNNAPIDGTLVAASYTGNAALNSAPYTGSFPAAAAPVPEPAGIAVTAAGLAGLAFARRRRQPVPAPAR